MDRSNTNVLDENYTADNLLPPFLRTLADGIENKHLTDKQIQKVGEFFMSYLFENQVERDNTEQDSDDEMSDKDFRKFLVMGWWIYTQIPTLLEEK